MPSLQRTPPQKVNRSPNKQPESQPDPVPATAPPNAVAGPSSSAPLPSRPSEGNTTLPSPSRAFVPRNQRVMRTPPGGSSESGQRQMLPPPSPVPTSTSASTAAVSQSPARRSPRTTRTIAPELVSGRETDVIMDEVQQDADAFADEQIAAGTSTIPPPSINTAGADTNVVSTTPTRSPPIRMAPAPTVNIPTPKAAAVPQSSHVSAQSTAAAPAVSTAASAPAPRTPRTRRTAASGSLADAPLPTLDVEDVSEWGKRYSAMQKALELAVLKASRKWTRRDLEGIFPLLSAKFPDDVKSIHTDAVAKMSEHIESSARSHFEHYKVGRATQMLDEVVKDANEYAAKSSESRPDAWRPDLTPAALTAAANLGIYDEAYDRLRTEYLALHSDCSTRYASIQAKQAQLAELENSVSEGVIELDKTLAAVDGFPTAEMKDWAETAMGKMEGGRVAERA